MFCWNCKTQINDDAKFCFSCGSPVQSEKENIQAPSAVEPAPELELTKVMPEKSSDDMMIPNQFESQASSAPMPQIINNTPQPAAPYVAINNDNSLKADLEKAGISDSENNKTKKKGKSTFIKFIFSFLFGILVFIFSLIASLGLIIRITLDNKEFSNAISKSDLSDIVIGDIITETGLNDTLKSNNIITGSVKKDDTIADLISDYSEFSTKKAKKLLNNSFLTKYIGDAVSEYEEYILNNVESDFFSGDNVYDFVEESIDDISEIAGMQFIVYENELSSLTDDIDDQISSIAPQEMLNENGKLTSLILSPVILISISVLILIFIILIFITTSDITSSLTTSGICALLDGGIFLIVSFFKNRIFEYTGLDFEIFTEYISNVLEKTICVHLEKNGLILIIAGVTLITVSIIIKVVSSSLRKNKSI